MLRATCFAFLFVVAGLGPLWAQPAPSTPEVFNAKRTALNQRGMVVLGTWAAGNIGLSGARYFATEGREKYFHQMNVGWGVINLALAGSALLATRHPNLTPNDRASTVRSQLRTEKLYLLNAGLDVAYVTAGFYLKERARSRAGENKSRLTGYGQSLLLQGGFLLAFDGLMYAAHQKHGRQGLYPLLSRVQVGPGAVAVVLPLR